MAESISGLVDLQHRLARLEREQRWWRGLAFGVMVAGGSVLVAFTDPAPEVLQAERVELVTRQGVRQAQFSTDSLGLTMTLFDRHGVESASFRFNDEPRLTVLNESRREVAGLGAPRPQHLAQ